ncbi:MAG: SDR family NAD(P)-dependent oxidoreductase [Ruminococcaceae bacterium]|nr:SDR family NAD(P)-dependent oxidoreductase [Oscillospiraceae bacterium]
MSRNVVIITGASSGMGMEFALQLDAHLRKTDEIWLIARRKERLEHLASKMRNKTRILAMDVTKEAQIERLADTLVDKDMIVKMLVNCAGFGIIGDFSQMTVEEQLSMVRTNCEALTHITHTCIPFMRKNSRIINLASSASFMPQPGFAVYAATKAYVNSFSLALREELKGKGIYVTSVCPGPVDTAFFDIAESEGNGTLAIKKIFMADPVNVVRKALRDSCHKKAKSVYSLPMQSFEVLCKVIPHGIILPLVRFIKE